MKSVQKRHIRKAAGGESGLACLQAVLQHHEIEVSIRALRRAIDKRPEEISLLNILKAGRLFGLQGRGYQADPGFLQKCTSPCILHVVKQQTASTFVVFYGYDPQRQRYWIGDPEQGSVKACDEKQLQEIWISGCLVSFQSANVLLGGGRPQRKHRLQELIRPDFRVLGLILALGVMLSGLVAGAVIFSQQLIDQLLSARDESNLWPAAAKLFLLLLLGRSLAYIRQLLLLRQSKDLFVRLDLYFFRALLEKPASFFAGFRTQELVQRLHAPDRLQEKWTALLGDGLLYLPMLLMATGLLSYFSLLLGLVASLACAAYGLAAFLWSRNLPDPRHRQERLLKLQLTRAECLRNHRLIRLWNRQSVFSGIASYYYDEHYQKSTFQEAKAGGRYDLYLAFVAIPAAILTFLLVFGQFLQAHISLGQFLASLLLLVLCARAGRVFSEACRTLPEVRAALDQLREFESGDHSYLPQEAATTIKVPVFESLVAEDLTFRRAGSIHGLAGVSFRLEKGELVMISGAGGSGKSTLLQLIQRDLTPSSGSIRVNGVDLRQLPAKDWNDRLAVVCAQGEFFQGSLLDNILMGAGNVDRKEVEAFMATFGFDRWFRSLPGGYDTTFDKQGDAISGAQRQLLSLARALWKKPDLLLLDQPTDALDPEAARFFIQVLKKAKAHMGILWITNRKVPGIAADRYFILKNGSMVSCVEEPLTSPAEEEWVFDPQLENY